MRLSNRLLINTFRYSRQNLGTMMSTFECGLAEMVTVECPSYTEVKVGVLLKEGFVTVNQMEHKMSVMEHKMSVKEHRMKSWTNRMRDLDRAHMQHQMRLMQQRMRADMATEMDELRDSALLHCKGMRKIAFTQVSVSYCGICFDKEVSGYICQQCPYAVCIRCFSMAFQTRVYSVDSSIDYTCPYCIQTFASFPEVSIDHRW